MGALVALLSAVLLVAVDATPSPGRHAVSNRFVLPRTFVRSSVATAASPNAIVNGGFESGAVNNGWLQCGDAAAYVLRAHPYAGMYDEFSGKRNGGGEPAGNSGVCQRVTIPPSALLSVQLFQLSNEESVAFAYQEADLLDDRGNLVVNLYRSVNDRPAWVRGNWNLGAYSGRTLWLYFGVHGDGYPNRSTQQYVDEVRLTAGSEAPSK
ncbi:MAG TPA: hypothetical protein VHT92_11365 [Candidatus Cybelea sp.]|jgi:hypothetical protein|nr:hypothetical protein [Candidatus Cybelea sp.]